MPQSAVKTNTVSAEPFGHPALTYEPTTNLLTSVVRAEISMNAVTSTQHNLPMTQPHGQVSVGGRTVDLDAPPKPIPATMWM